MGRSLPEIHAELRAALEGAPPPQGRDWLERINTAQEFVRSLNFEDADIVSIKDFAVACVQKWNHDHLEFNRQLGLECGIEGAQAMAHQLGCLLEPTQEELLPPDEPTDWRIWEIFAAAQIQQRQFCILTQYQYVMTSSCKLPENSPVVQAIQKFQGLQASFQQAHSHLASHMRISSELETKLTNFEIRLSQFLDHGSINGLIGLCELLNWATIVKNVQWMQLRCQWLSAEASEIAAEVAKCTATSEADSRSWSVISPNPSGQVASMPHDTVGELGSVASGYSLGSERSYLSGSGGPHCFLPSHLFKVLLPGEEFPSSVSAKDWGSKLFLPAIGSRGMKGNTLFDL